MQILPEQEKNYESKFSGFNGPNPPDNYLGDFDGKSFSTYDSDNDGSSENCAKKCGAGFWYSNCDTGSEMGNIHEPPGTSDTAGGCGGFSWDKPDPDIQLKETRIYMICL